MCINSPEQARIAETLINGAINNIANIEDFDIIWKDNKISLIYKYENIETIKNIEFSNSRITKCLIKNKDDIISDKNKYSSILTDIYNNVPLNYLKNKYCNSKTYNFEKKERIKNYNWNNKHKFSWRGKDSNNTIKDIIDIVNDNNFDMVLHIKLENEKELKYKL